MKVQGIFISRLVEGGLAESTGLLAVNDEVLEVNGIEVSQLTGTNAGKQTDILNLVSKIWTEICEIKFIYSASKFSA